MSSIIHQNQGSFWARTWGVTSVGITLGVFVWTSNFLMGKKHTPQIEKEHVESRSNEWKRVIFTSTFGAACLFLGIAFMESDQLQFEFEDPLLSSCLGREFVMRKPL